MDYFTIRVPKPHKPTAVSFRWLLPTPGNVFFTLFILSGMLWATNVGALPFKVPALAGDSRTTLSYQGRLANSSGTPINSAGVSMQYRLYTTNTGGTPVWQETQASVPVENGLFNVLLGSVTPIPLSLLTANRTLWLGVTVGSDSEMTPREQIASVPYAMVAQTLAGNLTASRVSLQQTTVQVGSFGTSSTTFVDIPGSTISVTIAQPSTLLVSFTGSLFSLMQANSAAGALLTISVDGIDRTDLVNQDISAWSGSVFTPNPAIMPAGFTVPIPVEVGSHTVKLRVLSSSVDPNYRSAGIGYNNRQSTFSAIVFAR